MKPSDRFGLSERALSSIRTIFLKYPEIDSAVLFGSRALGREKEGSDIDVSLKGPHLNLAKLNQVRIELDDLLLPYTFDLSIYQQIENRELLEHIDRVGIILYP